MAALEASVKPPRPPARPGAEKPVSVAEAREKKAARSKAAPRKAAASKAAADEAEEPAAKPGSPEAQVGVARRPRRGRVAPELAAANGANWQNLRPETVMSANASFRGSACTR